MVSAKALLIIALAIMSIPSGKQVYAQDAIPTPITVEQAVRHALTRPALAATIKASAAVEDAVGEQVSVWPNPVIGYAREEIFGGGHDETEDRAVLSQVLDLSGRRSLQADAATQRGRAARLEGEITRMRTAIETRRRFWEVVHQQARHDLTRDWVERLEKLVALVQQRKDAGEGSQYDTLRAAREVRSAKMEYDLADLDRESAWLELLALTGNLEAPLAWPRVQGELTPSPPAADLDQPLQRPDVRAWALREEAARLELEAAGRGWIPILALNAGWRTVEGAGSRGHGLAAGIDISIPLFDHGQGDAAAAQAEADKALAMGRLLAEDVQRQRRPALDRAARLTALAKRVRAETEAAARELEVTAQGAWQAGELDILELMAVHRDTHDDALAVLDLEHSARQAHATFQAIALEEKP